MIQWMRKAWSKRLTVVGITMVVWLIILFTDAETAVAVAPFQYALLVAYCGFESWRPHNE